MGKLGNHQRTVVVMHRMGSTWRAYNNTCLGPPSPRVSRVRFSVGISFPYVRKGGRDAWPATHMKYGSGTA